MAVHARDIAQQSESLKFIPRKRRAGAAATTSDDSASKRLSPSLPDERVPIDTPQVSGSSVPLQSSSDRPSSAAGSKIPQWRIDRERALSEQQARPERVKRWREKSRQEMETRDWRIMLRDLQITSNRKIEPLLHWSELAAEFSDPGLPARLEKLGFKEPTPVQRATLNLREKDVIAIAQTGSGKTLAFVLPVILSRASALVLAPTHELSLQTASVVAALSPQFPVVALVGGRDFSEQAAEFDDAVERSKRSGLPVLIVATPGRLLDFLDQGLVNLDSTSTLIFDEADRMIDFGFEDQIARIVNKLPSERQTLMFSATWPPAVKNLAARHLRDPENTVEIEVGTVAPVASVQQTVELLDNAKKLRRAVDVVRQAKGTIIAFVSTKAATEIVSSRFAADGIKAEPLHGSLSQETREAVLASLRSHRVKCIVATDVASRGVDIPDVGLVLNYDLPQSIDTYIHRIGRTGRAGRSGKAISFATPEDSALYKDLRRVLRDSGSAYEHIPTGYAE